MTVVQAVGFVLVAVALVAGLALFSGWRHGRRRDGRLAARRAQQDALVLEEQTFRRGLRS